MSCSRQPLTQECSCQHYRGDVTPLFACRFISATNARQFGESSHGFQKWLPEADGAVGLNASNDVVASAREDQEC